MRMKEIVKPYIIESIAMRLSVTETLRHLKDKGFKISRAYYFRIKKDIEESRFDRLNLIAKSQFVDQHLDRISNLETILSEMWKLYRAETNTFKKSQILMQIADLQSYISSFYDASRYVMEQSIKEYKDKNVIKKKSKKSISQ